MLEIVARVEDIEEAITKLSAEDYARFLQWFLERDREVWEQKMDRDAATGKLDFVRNEARDARKARLVRDWPSAE